MTASLLVVRGRRDGNVGRETRRDRAAVATRSDRPYGTASAPHTRHTAERGTGAFHAQDAHSGRGGQRPGGPGLGGAVGGALAQPETLAIEGPPGGPPCGFGAS